MKVQNNIDAEILKSEVGTILEYPDGSRSQVMFKTTDKVDGYFLTQIQTNNIKNNGELGRLTSWLKFRHYRLAQ